MRRKRRPVNVEPVELEITGLSHDARGIARFEDKVIFVRGALPQERVIATRTRMNSRYDEAQMTEVLVASPERAQPPCEHFGLCGGCQLQHLPPSLQISHKQTLLVEQLDHVKVEPQEWLAPLEGTDRNYRQKARLAVKYVEKKGMTLVGFHEQRSNKVAMIDVCRVLDARMGDRIHSLKTCLDTLESKAQIPQIEFAADDDTCALIFRHMKPMSEEDINKLIAFCEEANFELYLQPGNLTTVHKVWPADGKEYLTYRLPDQALQFRFHPLDFTQVNPDMNQKMINQALALLNPTQDDVVLDLFCGLGNFSLAFAQRAKSVVGVEGAAEMVGRAKDNAELNGLSNATFFACDLSQPLDEQPWVSTDYSMMILDPARCGAQSVVEQIDRFQVKRILYISCNPATFVRDAAILQHQHGYKLEKVGVMDMFTHTQHVETMGLFTLRE